MYITISPRKVFCTARHYSRTVVLWCCCLFKSNLQLFTVNITKKVNSADVKCKSRWRVTDKRDKLKRHKTNTACSGWSWLLTSCAQCKMWRSSTIGLLRKPRINEREKEKKKSSILTFLSIHKNGISASKRIKFTINSSKINNINKD